MAHFALIENNIVVNTIVVSDNDCSGGTFPESETTGQQFIKNILKFEGIWKQTSYNHNFRKQYGLVGFTYDSVSDVFIKPKPFASWILNENYDWEPPVPKPDGNYWWNESNQEWVL